MSSPAPAIGLRVATGDDRPLLETIYASTRAEELAPVPWSNEQKRAFIASQFRAQDTDYRRNYPQASFDVIVCDGAPAGRLYVDRRPEEIRIIDIALLPAFRGKGIGTRLIEQLLQEASVSGLPVSIHVERHNRALGLYRRLGFDQVADGDVYLLLRREPPVIDQANTAS